MRIEMRAVAAVIVEAGIFKRDVLRVQAIDARFRRRIRETVLRVAVDLGAGHRDVLLQKGIAHQPRLIHGRRQIRDDLDPVLLVIREGRIVGVDVRVDVGRDREVVSRSGLIRDGYRFFVETVETVVVERRVVEIDELVYLRAVIGPVVKRDAVAAVERTVHVREDQVLLQVRIIVRFVPGEIAAGINSRS